MALNSGVLRRSKWSGIETAADNLPAASVPLTPKRSWWELLLAISDTAAACGTFSIV